MQQDTAIIYPNKINCLYIRDAVCSLRRRKSIIFFLQAVSCRTLTMAARVPARAKYVRFVAHKVAMGQVFIPVHAVNAPPSLRR